MPQATLIRGLAFTLLMSLVLVFASHAAQAQNPFRPAPSATATTQAAPPPAVQEDSSLYHRALSWSVDLQRTMVRDIGRHMAAIRDGTSSTALLVGIGFAFLYGVVHTLGPGHGKMIVASYFVGREARIWRGLLMGIQIAIAHVVSAIALVFLVDITFRQMLGGEPAESWWIRLFSFGLIAIIGTVMLIRAIRSTMHDHEHDHDHAHDHGHDHHGHSHDGRQQGILALLAGLVPCTGAILIMLFALANGIVVAGVLMVIAISAGMALTMAAIGVAAILVRRVALLVTGEGSKRGYIVARALEYAAALMILAIGLSFLAGTLGEKFA